MRWSAIKAILLQEMYVTRASIEIVFDIFIFTLANIVLFGFITKYLVKGTTGSTKLEIESLVIAVVFWECLRITQYSMSVSSMWNVWSHNLSNMFIAPIRVSEYLIAHFISAVMKSMFILVTSMVLVRYIFQINVLSIGVLPVIFMYINMIIFATAVGLVLIGLVFQYGTRIQALTWGTIFMLQPFCAVYFPVNVLPGFLQPISYLFPATYFFEWVRAIHQHLSYSSFHLLLAFLFNGIYLLVACLIFNRQLAAAKYSGQLARNDL